MPPKSLLVLGAARYQLPAIEAAGRLGYRVVCADNLPTNPGHALADRSYIVDTTDKAGILDVARLEGIAGVIAPCTDVAVPTAAFVAEQMGLPGPPARAAEVVCDKVLFREFLRRRGFPVPRFFCLQAMSGVASALFDEQRWIMKPARSSGSKGAFIVTSAAEAAARLPDTMAFSPDGRAVLEEYLEGAQGTCEGIVQAGRVALAWILDRQTAPPPYVATSGHRVPTTLSAESQRRLLDDLEHLWRLLGVLDTVFDCDFVAGPEGVQLLEVTPRLGGNSIASLLKKASGFDITTYAVQLACGESPPLPEKVSVAPMAVLILGATQSGRLWYDEGAVDSLGRLDWLEDLSMDAEVGSPAEVFVNGRHRVGECFIRGSSYEDVVTKSHEVLGRLKISTM